ncbi:MAG: MarR family winged helix-turn-helix transcriptional regulator [Pseudomonadota bacterium]
MFDAVALRISFEVDMGLISQSEIDKILNIRIIRLASKLSLIFQRETLRPAGLNVQQWRILVSLAQADELHLRALARASSNDPAHTSRVTKSMIEKGWISCREDRSDGRRKLYSLAEAGTEIVNEIWPHASKFAAEVSAIFTKGEFDAFKDMLDRASAACDGWLDGESRKGGGGNDGAD